MPQILVLVDHVDGAVRKTTTELLTLARRLGEPAAVFIGQGVDAAQPTLAEFGAAVVYAAEADGLEDYLVLAKVEALAAVIEAAGGAGDVGAVLISSTAEGKEIAARLSVRLDSGVITDAVDVDAGPDGAPRTTQQAFAGSFAVLAEQP